jgi:hypothetical protein
MSKVFRLLAMAAVFIGVTAIAFAVEKENLPREGIILISSPYSALKPPVRFNHAAHATTVGNCQTCHHDDPAGQGSKCTRCHKATNVETDVINVYLEKGSRVNLIGSPGKMITPDAQSAFHKLCDDCHVKNRVNLRTRRDCTVCHGGRWMSEKREGCASCHWGRTQGYKEDLFLIAPGVAD